MTAIAEAEGTILPYSTIELAQRYFDPACYPAEERERAAELLRARTGNMGTVISEPATVAAELGKQLVTVERLHGWMRAIDRPIVCGGRMRTGFPEEDGEFGAGSEERFLGCHVEALQALHQHGLTPFLELPSGSAARAGRIEGCAWTFHIGTRRLTLDDVTDSCTTRGRRGPRFPPKSSPASPQARRPTSCAPVCRRRAPSSST